MPHTYELLTQCKSDSYYYSNSPTSKWKEDFSLSSIHKPTKSQTLTNQLTPYSPVTKRTEDFDQIGLVIAPPSPPPHPTAEVLWETMSSRNKSCPST